MFCDAVTSSARPWRPAVLLVDDHPARAVAAVDVEHDEKVVVDAAGRALELGDVIRPDFVRPGRDELRDRARGWSPGGGAQRPRRWPAIAGTWWTARPNRSPRPTRWPRPGPCGVDEAARSTSSTPCCSLGAKALAGVGRGLGAEPFRLERPVVRARNDPRPHRPLLSLRVTSPQKMSGRSPLLPVLLVALGEQPPKSSDAFPGFPPPVSSSRAQPRLVRLAFWSGELGGERVVLRWSLFCRGRRAHRQSRARRHSTMWLVYRPSRRNRAPLSPSPAQRSYSSRISSL